MSVQHAGRAAVRGLAALLFVLGLAQPAQADRIFFQGGTTDRLYSLDTNTLVETLIGNMGVAGSWGFSFHPNGTLYGLTRADGNLYTINTSNASLTLVGNAGVAFGGEALTFDLAGTTLFTTLGSNLYSINPSSGAGTLIGSLGDGVTLAGLTVAPVPIEIVGLGLVGAGTILGVQRDTGRLFVVDTVTPGSTLIGTLSGLNPEANETLAFGPTGTLYGHDNAGRFSTIGLNPIGSTFLFSTSLPFVTASAVQPAVTEPGTVLLLGLGLAGLGLRRRSAR